MVVICVYNFWITYLLEVVDILTFYLTLHIY
jgi:hypothetical protein